MASIINAVSGSGITSTADGSGIIKIQSNSVTTNALAWVNFNGTGTVAIRSSYNVSSITDNGTGDYTVNFTTALSDANYAFGLGGHGNTSASTLGYVTGKASGAGGYTPTTTGLRVSSANGANGAVDIETVTVTIHGN
jgi:hypothetical protein